MCLNGVCLLWCMCVFCERCCQFSLFLYTHSTANVCQIKFVVVVVDFSIFATEGMGLHVRFMLYNNDNNISESKNEKQRGNAHEYTISYKYTHMGAVYSVRTHAFNYFYRIHKRKKLWKPHAHIDARLI